MQWKSLDAVRKATRLMFDGRGYRAHSFVRCVNGGWTRTYGPPAGSCKHISGNVYHQTEPRGVF